MEHEWLFWVTLSPCLVFLFVILPIAAWWPEKNDDDQG